MSAAKQIQPAWYIPHGGGPCFFMAWTLGPADTWNRMASWLRGLAATLPELPKAIIVISAHWEEPVFAVTAAARPVLIYDYYGFPEYTYQLTYPASGEPELAGRVVTMLEEAGLQSKLDPQRGFDHGMFVPFKLIFPAADIPVLQVSLQTNLDPQRHLQLGQVLADLRQQGILLVGSGMSYHNMQSFGQPQASRDSAQFDRWLTETIEQTDFTRRTHALLHWSDAPAALASHPRAEHLIPLLVIAGAATSEAGRRIFSDQVMAAEVSAYQFG